MFMCMLFIAIVSQMISDEFLNLHAINKISYFYYCARPHIYKFDMLTMHISAPKARTKRQAQILAFEFGSKYLLKLNKNVYV